MSQIEIYADVVCPFTYVGLIRLFQERSALGREDVRFRIRSWPLERVNGEPVAGSFIGHEIDEIAPQIAPDLFTGFRADNFPSTSIPSLALTIAAYSISDEVGEGVAMALRRALFEDGLDIANPRVLQQLAAEFGITDLGDPALVESEYQAGKLRGVVGSPHFLIGESSQFCPVLDITKDDDHLRVKIDEPAMNELFKLCFAP